MTRIKSNNVQLGGSFIVPIEQSPHNAKIQEALEKEKEIIRQGELRAAETIANAQRQGEELIEQAKAEANSRVDEIIQQAHNAGYNAGYQEGFAKITEEMQQQVVSVNNFAQSTFDVKNNIIKSAHLDILKLVIEIAHKICSKSLELNDDILKEITKNAIMALKDKENITIIVNPEMAGKIYAISEEFKEEIVQLSSIKIIEDNSVSPDGTIVESPLSRVDCRIKSQINEIAEKLIAKLDSTPIEQSEKGEQGTENVQG